ncbi:hypothetical protein [Persicobacter sp. CCB-QB2]|uniref:hypothetical protein n=1 Tax=Persicobacter sp. CCB-QB2 TaxID=1561025 RepID=UPI0006A95184|nr:hypothetical protein [Persicobacter sp. CCB-QB2]
MDFFERMLYPCRWGLTLSVLAIFLGFLIGGLFGANEDALKNHLKTEGQAVLSTVYQNDEAAMNKTVAKSWSYLKRAHLHAGAIGAAALALLLLLGALPVSYISKLFNSWLIGLGALIYPIFWLLAGLKAPGLGSTHAAKESLNWLAIPSAGALLIGTFLIFLLCLKVCFQPKSRY